MSSLVSIVIPCYNAARWLEATLESALGQTWPNTEIIVVDDGSTDASAALAEGFAPRGVRTVRQPNRNACSARNHGLRLARGDFVQFLDADDLLSPEKIAAQMELLRVASAPTVASCAWGRFYEDPAATQFRDASVCRDFAPARDFLVHAAASGDMMQPAAWLAPRSLLVAAGPWDETLTLNDDGEYFCRVLVRAAAVRFAPRGCVHYRSGIAGSLSRHRSLSAMKSLHRSQELFAQHLLAAEDSPRVRSALANFWERARYELYPAAPDLSADAGRRARHFGAPGVPPPFGPRLRVVARLLGWKIARRLQVRGVLARRPPPPRS